MKTLLIILIAISLAGCANVRVNKTGEGDWDIKYKVLWRNIEEVTATVGDVEFSLGSASSEVTLEDMLAACALAPPLCEGK